MSRLMSAGALLTVSLGCSDLPALEYETKYLRIGTDFDGPICAGTLHEFDEQVAFVQATLGFEIDHKVELYLFDTDVSKWCEEPALGCYSHAEDRAWTTLPLAKHEIVHAATGQLMARSAGDAFLDEGFAVDLSGSGLIFPLTDPSSNLGLLPPQVSRNTAGHFMRWLRERYSAPIILQMWRLSRQGRGETHTAVAFEQATGESFYAIEQLYFDEAPEYYAPLAIVSPPTVEPEYGGWDIVLDFDCDTTDTQGYDDEMWRTIRIEVVSSGRYVLLAQHATMARISRHRSEDLAVGDAYPQRPSSPVHDDLFEPPKPWHVGIPVETELDVGIYDIKVRVSGVSATTATVRIHPQLGPIPEKP